MALKRRVQRISCVVALAAALIFGTIGAGHAGEDARIPQNAATVLRRNPGAAMVGGDSADVILIEYFDYNCPYCKKLVPALQALLQSDSKIAIIYKDWPILGDNSTYAARAALAAGWQGRYLAAHDALLGGPRLSGPAQIDALLQRQGIDLERLDADRIAHAAEIDERLARIDSEANALGIRGTPSLIVGRWPVAGDLDAGQLRQAVATARRNP